ncbi:hypothetical protein J4459_04225 [Candidatus Woesearchaeota archaeon]|nr:hypothetical protein [Candidatus Woesearchaeota archaeon]
MIIDDILKKKTLNKIDRSIVQEYLPNIIPEKKREYKKLVKEVRNELNRVYGVFQLGTNLDLKSHKSTKERIEIYPTLYKRIFNLTGKPKSILDLGCGLNPLSYIYLGNHLKYIASEWNRKDCLLLEEWFKNNKIKGSVIQYDLRKENKFPKVDVVFLFKILGIFKNHKIDEQIIKSLKCKYFIVSFATEILKGNKMRYPKQLWFELMLGRLEFNYSKIDFKNESFYIVKMSH